MIIRVGYAAFSSLLTINGTAGISNTWCVGFDNTMTSTMEVTKGVSTGTTPTGSMSYSGTACGTNLVPTSSLIAHFYQPGDQIEYTLTIVNKSTVTAAIKSILVDNESVTSDTTKKKDNITYIIEMPESTTLAPNASTTMKVTAKFQNDTDVTGSYSGETKTIEVKINAEQDDGNGGFTPTPVGPTTYTGTIYRWSSDDITNGDSIATVSETKWCPKNNEYNGCEDNWYYETETECNQDLQEEVSQGWFQEGEYSCEQGAVTLGGIGEYIKLEDYSTYSARATALEHDYYLKHDVVNDIITDTYVCFVYNNAEQCMKGGDNGASFAANTQIIKDFQTFNSLPDNANPGCYFESEYSQCNGGGFDYINADSNGNVVVLSGNYQCVYNLFDESTSAISICDRTD